jgi:hypothetical protein
VWCAPAAAYTVDVGAPASRLRGVARSWWSRIDLYDDGVVATAVPVDTTAAVVVDLDADELARSMA